MAALLEEVSLISLEANQALIRRFLEVYGKNHDEARELLNSEWTDDLEGYGEGFALFSVPFPDLKFTIKNMIAEGHEVMALLEWRGTHRGPLHGIPPTGREVKLEEVAIFRVTEGKITAVKFIRDKLTMRQQLREIPPMFRHP